VTQSDGSPAGPAHFSFLHWQPADDAFRHSLNAATPGHSKAETRPSITAWLTASGWGS